MRVGRPWLAGVAVLAALALIALVYRPAKQFHRFFLFIIGTQSTPQSLLQAIMAALQARNLPLAQENNLGMSLETHRAR